MNISMGERRPKVADTAWISPTAVLIGDVHLRTTSASGTGQSSEQTAHALL
jgi:carbonic anhydrase/acetyltransferase-like protein (isoleucine patch superfamily)